MQLLIITDDLELKLLKKSKRFTVLGPLQTEAVLGGTLSSAT